MLAQFQSVNDPAKPLISLSRAEQEQILVRLTEEVERAAGHHQPVTIDAEAEASAAPEEGVNTVPLIKRMRLSECLERIGCKKELLAQEEGFIRKWLGQRMAETWWRGEGLDVAGYLKKLGEPEHVFSEVASFVDEIVACCAPGHGRVGSMYVSIKKVSDAYRLLQRELGAGLAPGADDPSDQSCSEFTNIC